MKLHFPGFHNSTESKLKLIRNSSKMRGASSILPTRFLLLVAHFVIAISIFWSRVRFIYRCLKRVQDQNVDACTSHSTDSSERSSKENGYVLVKSRTWSSFELAHVKAPGSYSKLLKSFSISQCGLTLQARRIAFFDYCLLLCGVSRILFRRNYV